MGGKSSAQKQMEAQNVKQMKENERIKKENELRLKEQERLNENFRRKQSYENALQERESKAVKEAIKARDTVWDERIKLFKNAKNLLTNFELQEKMRLLKAKKGQGQVKPEDEAITGEDRQNAIDLMNKPEEYWKNLAQEKYDQTYKSIFDSITVDEPTYLEKEEPKTPASSTKPKPKGLIGNNTGTRKGYYNPWGQDSVRNNQPGKPGKMGIDDV